MTDTDLNAYIQLLMIAASLGATLVSAIKDHAKKELTEADFALLEARWQDLADRTARNAGLA